MKNIATKLKEVAKIDLRSSVLLIFSVFMMSPFVGSSQENYYNIGLWGGWKTGNVIKVEGIIKNGNPMTKTEGDKKFLTVIKIDDKKIEESISIEIAYHKQLFSTVKDGDTVTLLGYVSGGFHGIPNFGDYDLEYWQDSAFQFDLYFVVLKIGDEIKLKKK